jgi:hypothetical protein
MAGIFDAIFHGVDVVAGMFDGNFVALAVGATDTHKEDVVTWGRFGKYEITEIIAKNVPILTK